MPRPTPAQLAYGSITVVCSALAMLLLSQTRSGPGVVVIAVAALTLGVFVAVTAPMLHPSRRVRGGRLAASGGPASPAAAPPGGPGRVRVTARGGAAPASRTSESVSTAGTGASSWG